MTEALPAAKAVAPAYRAGAPDLADPARGGARLAPAATPTLERRIGRARVVTGRCPSLARAMAVRDAAQPVLAVGSCGTGRGKAGARTRERATIAKAPPPRLCSAGLGIGGVAQPGAGLVAAVAVRVCACDPAPCGIVTLDTRVSLARPEARERPHRGMGGLDLRVARVRGRAERRIRSPDLFEGLDTRPARGLLLVGASMSGTTRLPPAVASAASPRVPAVDAPETVFKHPGDSNPRLCAWPAGALCAAPSIVVSDGIAHEHDETSGGKPPETRVAAHCVGLMNARALAMWVSKTEGTARNVRRRHLEGWRGARPLGRPRGSRSAGPGAAAS